MKCNACCYPSNRKEKRKKAKTKAISATSNVRTKTSLTAPTDCFTAEQIPSSFNSSHLLIFSMAKFLRILAILIILAIFVDFENVDLFDHFADFWGFWKCWTFWSFCRFLRILVNFRKKNRRQLRAQVGSIKFEIQFSWKRRSAALPCRLYGRAENKHWRRRVYNGNQRE